MNRGIARSSDINNIHRYVRSCLGPSIPVYNSDGGFRIAGLTNGPRSRNTRAMAKAKQAASKKVTPIAYTLTMDKRRAKILLNMLGAIELRMFEKGYRPTESQMNTVAELRKQLSEQVHGQPEASLEEQLAAAVEWSGGHK